MKTITPLRQKFIDHLTLRQLSERTVQTYIHWVADLARFHKASPDALGRPEISSFVLHLIQERKLSDCSVTLAIKSLRPIASPSMSCPRASPRSGTTDCSGTTGASGCSRWRARH